MNNTCVCCGVVIPEGRQVCKKCESIGSASPMRLWGIYNINAETYVRNRSSEIMFFTLREQAESMIAYMKLNPKIYVAREYRR